MTAELSKIGMCVCVGGRDKKPCIRLDFGKKWMKSSESCQCMRYLTCQVSFRFFFLQPAAHLLPHFIQDIADIIKRMTWKSERKISPFTSIYSFAASNNPIFNFIEGRSFHWILLSFFLFLAKKRF